MEARNLIVDKSTKCDNPNCGAVIPSSGWKFAAVTDTPNGALVFCCSNCRVQAGHGGTGRICIVIPEGAPIPKTSGCYVATCVYGSYDCQEVWTLRRFRDDTLSNSWLGKHFIKMYYATSPKIVKTFGNKRWFNLIFKSVLDKFVKKLQNKGVSNSQYSD